MAHRRLRNDKNGGAWCPRQMVSRDAKEYLEINLEELYVITGGRTQGRFGNGQGQEYAEEYMIEYWRPGFTKWIRWKNRDGKEVKFHLFFVQFANKNRKKYLLYISFYVVYKFYVYM